MGTKYLDQVAGLDREEKRKRLQKIYNQTRRLVSTGAQTTMEILKAFQDLPYFQCHEMFNSALLLLFCMLQYTSLDDQCSCHPDNVGIGE